MIIHDAGWLSMMSRSLLGRLQIHMRNCRNFFRNGGRRHGTRVANPMGMVRERESLHAVPCESGKVENRGKLTTAGLSSVLRVLRCGRAPPGGGTFWGSLAVVPTSSTLFSSFCFGTSAPHRVLASAAKPHHPRFGTYASNLHTWFLANQLPPQFLHTLAGTVKRWHFNFPNVERKMQSEIHCSSPCSICFSSMIGK